MLGSETRRKELEQQPWDIPGGQLEWGDTSSGQLGTSLVEEEGRRKGTSCSRATHLSFSPVLSCQAPESSKEQGEMAPLMALSSLQLLIVALAVPQFIPKAGTAAGMFIYYCPK